MKRSTAAILTGLMLVIGPTITGCGPEDDKNLSECLEESNGLGC